MAGGVRLLVRGRRVGDQLFAWGRRVAPLILRLPVSVAAAPAVPVPELRILRLGRHRGCSGALLLGHESRKHGESGGKGGRGDERDSGQTISRGSVVKVPVSPTKVVTLCVPGVWASALAAAAAQRTSAKAASLPAVATVRT